MSANPPEQAIERALSVPRIATYQAATTGTPPLEAALKLYAWNAQVSAALLNPLHCCEVVVRNAVSEALELVYGANWPWDNTFYLSLANPRMPAFNPRYELDRVRNTHHTTGKVIADLKFAFWQSMFTGRFDGRLWIPHLHAVLPNLSTAHTVQVLRRTIHDDLERLRKLRNRIAHHEPIFNRSLAVDLQTVENLVSYRCTVTAAWMMANQTVAPMFAAKPP